MPNPPTPEEAARERAKQIAQQARARQQARAGTPGEAEPIDHLRARTALEDYRQDIRLKKEYGRNLFLVMVAQLAIANLGFFLYAWLGVKWKVQPSVMHTWLGATVVEVIAVVVVVTRYLFPRRDQGS